MNWFLFAVLSIITLSSYNLVLKLASSKINVVLALPIIGFAVLLVGIVGYFFKNSFHNQIAAPNLQGIFLAFFVGLTWAVAQIFYFSMFSKNAPASVGVPLVVGGITTIVTIIGVAFLKEPLTTTKVLGIIFMLAGFFFIAK